MKKPIQNHPTGSDILHIYDLTSLTIYKFQILYKIWNFHVKYTIRSLWNLGVATRYGKTAAENWRLTQGTIFHMTDNLLNPVLSDYLRWIHCKMAAIIITVLFSSCARSAFYNPFSSNLLLTSILQVCHSKVFRLKNMSLAFISQVLKPRCKSTEILCITCIVEHNYISLSTVGIQLNVSAL